MAGEGGGIGSRESSSRKLDVVSFLFIGSLFKEVDALCTYVE